MHVKFTHGFILDRNLEIVLLSYSGSDRPVTAAEVSNTYQFITLSLRLNPAVTWSDRYTFRNAWLVTSTVWRLAQPAKHPQSLTNRRLSRICDWRNIVIQRAVYRVLVGKPEGKRPLGRPRRRWVDNIRMDLQEVDCGYVDWIGLAQDRDRWRTLVSAVMNLRVPWNAGNFLTSWKPVSFSGRTLHRGVSK